LMAYMGESRDLWRDYFEHFGVPVPDLSNVSKFHQLLMLADAAVSGQGFDWVPLFLFEHALAAGRLIQAIPHALEHQRGYFVTHPQGADHDKKVQIFKKWILAEARRSAKN